MAKRRKLPKKFRARSVSDEEKLRDARRMHDDAEAAVFRAVGKLAQARELVITYERKLGLDPKARSAHALVDLARAQVKAGARSWLDKFGFDVPEDGGMPQKKATHLSPEDVTRSVKGEREAAATKPVAKQKLVGFRPKVIGPGYTEYHPIREDSP